MENIESWYEGLNIPNTWGYKAMGFVGLTLGLVANVGVTEGLSVRWVEIPGGLGYADPNNGVIGLSKELFDVEQKKRYNPKARVSEAMTAGCGVIMHELAHVLWSPPTMTEIINAAGLPNNQLAATVCNIVEDHFIEAEIQNFTWTSWMIFGAWEYMFPEEKIFGVRKAWDGTKGGKVGDALNALIVLKNWNVVQPPRTDYEAALQEICRDARFTKKLSERAKLMHKLYYLLVSEEDTEEAEGGSGGSGEGEPGEGDGSGEGEFDTSMEEGIPAPSSMSNFDTDGRIRSDMTVEQIRTGYRTEIGKGRNLNKASTVEVGDGEERRIVLEYTVEPSQNSVMQYSQEWAKLGKTVRALSGSRYVRGDAAFSGKKLSHLQNTFSTGKVFSTAYEEGHNDILMDGSPEVMLLLDFSSSMSGTELRDTVEAAYGATKAFDGSRIKSAMYGFTSSHEVVHGATVIYEFKKFSENSELGRKRLVNYGTLDLGGTPDGLAITHVVKKFGKFGTRMLIVITDGQGDNSDFSCEAVAKARAAGIVVVGVAITDAAHRHCVQTYGEKYTVRSNDPNVMASIFEKMFK